MQRILYFLYVVALLLALPKATACISEPPSERYYVTYFDCRLSGSDTTLVPCYVDAKLMEPFRWDTPPEKLFATNLTEWKYFCQNQPSLTDIWKIVYELPLEAFRANGSSFSLPDSVKRNSFVQYLQRSNTAKDVLPYLHLLKQSEHYTQSFEPWEEDTLRANLTAIRPVLAQLKSNYQTVSSDFLKLRYAYIALRLARSSGAESVADLYDALVLPLLNKKNLDPLTQKSKVRYWALALKAGTLLEKDNPTALYLFAQCFLHDPEKRGLYLFNFNVYDDTSFEKALQLAKTDDEKATLWLMFGSRITAFDHKPLESLYKTVPNSPFLNVLLVREINKIERYSLSNARMLGDSTLLKKIDTYFKDYYKQKYGDDYYGDGSGYDETGNNEIKTNGGDENTNSTPQNTEKKSDKGFFGSIGDFFSNIFATIASWFGASSEPVAPSDNLALQDAAYIQELLSFVSQTAKESKVADVALWQTAAAYLHYLVQQPTEARQWVKQLVPAATEPIRNQALLVDCLARLSEGTIDETLENDFATALRTQKIPLYEYDNYSVASRSLTLLAQKYWQKGDLIKAILCFDKAKETTTANKLLEFMTTQKDLDNLLARIDATNHTALERFLLDKSRLTHDVVLDIQGTKLMQEGQFEAALGKYLQTEADHFPPFSGTPVAQEEYSPNNIYDEFGMFSANFTKNATDKQRHEGAKLYHRKSFAQKTVELFKKAQQNPAKADQYYYQLANGFASSPFWAYNSRIWNGGMIYAFYEHPGSFPTNITPQAEQLWEAEQKFWKNYGSGSMAIQFYEKVIATTKDNELAAKSAYLIKYSQLNPQTSVIVPDTTDLTYTRLLSQKYKQTQFYQDILRECPSLSAYMGK